MDRLLKPMNDDIMKVEELLGKILSQMEQPLQSMLKTSLRGGKRLRPVVVILCGQLFKIPRKKMHVLAAAVEVLHSATLIHDDLVDDASLRRGRKTIHAIWPAGASVLAGDYLLAQSVCLVSQLENPGVLRILAETLYTMSAGEINYHYSKKDRKRREVYFQSINAKTASLFAGAMEMVGVLAGVKRNELTNLRAFGREFGIAYQIVDDVLDLISDEQKLGKPAGSDLAQGVVTLPVICYLERNADDRVVHKILSGKATKGNLKKVISNIRRSGAIDDALDEARAHARKSKTALSRLPAGKSRQALYDLVDYITERQH
ncbi:MAG: polyprenyl synthetase family protein [candidate division WOR-3 bacterium]|jgi:geranylgeranyl pyrophosphate synthase